MVKNNRTNEDDLRGGIKEKARLAKEETAQERVLEAEHEERAGSAEINKEKTAE